MELLHDLRATMASNSALPRADEKRLRAVADGILELKKSFNSVASNPFVDPSDPFYAATLIYLSEKERRETRSAVAYLKWRLDAASDLWWSANEDVVTDSLTVAEKGYLRDYGALMVSYMSSFDVPLDLRAHTWRPPTTSGVIEVRGLVDYSFVSPATGRTVSVYAAKQCCVTTEDAEPLLRRGIVTLVPQGPG